MRVFFKLAVFTMILQKAFKCQSGIVCRGSQFDGQYHAMFAHLIKLINFLVEFLPLRYSDWKVSGMEIPSSFINGRRPLKYHWQTVVLVWKNEVFLSWKNLKFPFALFFFCWERVNATISYHIHQWAWQASVPFGDTNGRGIGKEVCELFPLCVLVRLLQFLSASGHVENTHKTSRQPSGMNEWISNSFKQAKVS